MLVTALVVEDIVKKLNTEFDLPFLSEQREEAILTWLVESVTPHVPHWVLAFMASAADGLTREELATHRDVIIVEVNKKLDLPGTPDFVEERLIAFVVDAILEYAVKGFTAPKV